MRSADSPKSGNRKEAGALLVPAEHAEAAEEDREHLLRQVLEAAHDPRADQVEAAGLGEEDGQAGRGARPAEGRRETRRAAGRGLPEDGEGEVERLVPRNDHEERK